MCSQPGCPDFSIYRGRCARHAASRERARGTRQQRGYTNAWLTLVKKAIREHPWCAECGATKDLTGDHIIPRSRGGQNVIGNIRVLCRSCNSAKGNR